jgi:hypothetical protein
VIQYSEALVMNSEGCGVLDTPLARSMTAVCEAAKAFAAYLAPLRRARMGGLCQALAEHFAT